MLYIENIGLQDCSMFLQIDSHINMRAYKIVHENKMRMEIKLISR